MTTLVIKNERLTYRQILGRMERCDELTRLTLENLKIDGDEDNMLRLSKFIRGHFTLEEIIIRNIETMDPSVDLTLIVSTILVSVFNIKTLVLENCPFRTSALACLEYCECLENLYLEQNGFTNEDAEAIAGYMERTPSQLSLYFTNNYKVGHIGRHTLKSVIKKNTNIVSIVCEEACRKPPHENCIMNGEENPNRLALAA
jgi:hypothetical protein